MSEGGERAEVGDATLRKEAADKLVLERQKYLEAVYGTADHAGRDPARWRPYHVVENRLWTQALEKVFNAALESKTKTGAENPDPSLLTNLEEGDLPAMLIAASYFYPNFNDFYRPSSYLAHEYMRRKGIFRQRDFDIVDACINAAILKEKPEDIIVAKSFNDQISDERAHDYRAHKKVFFDVTMGCNNSLSQTPYLVALLGVEKLIEKYAIHTEQGLLPSTLEEVIDPSTTYKSDILRDHIVGQNTNFFKANLNYAPQLLTSFSVLPHFRANQNFFITRMLPKLKERHINIADMLQETRMYSRRGSAETSGHEWVASLA